MTIGTLTRDGITGMRIGRIDGGILGRTIIDGERGQMTILAACHEKDALELCSRDAYTWFLLCDGPKQEERAKLWCIAESRYERRLASGLRPRQGMAILGAPLVVEPIGLCARP